MAEAALSVVIQEHITRRNYLNLDITNLQDRKNLAVRSQSDAQVLLNARKNECRTNWKAEFDGKKTYYNDLGYKDYTEIPEFEEEIDRITAEIQDEIDQLTAWETQIDAQITTDSAELEEINAFLDSYKEMLSSNISEDFDYGLN